jgi:hypothetical protein
VLVGVYVVSNSIGDSTILGVHHILPLLNFGQTEDIRLKSALEEKRRGLVLSVVHILVQPGVRLPVVETVSGGRGRAKGKYSDLGRAVER